jgi:hypothetical protein
MTWRQVIRELSKLPDNKLDGEALLYHGSEEFGAGESEVIKIRRLTTIDGDLAEEFDLVDGDPLLIA